MCSESNLCISALMQATIISCPDPGINLLTCLPVAFVPTFPSTSLRIVLESTHMSLWGPVMNTPFHVHFYWHHADALKLAMGAAFYITEASKCWSPYPHLLVKQWAVCHPLTLSLNGFCPETRVVVFQRHEASQLPCPVWWLFIKLRVKPKPLWLLWSPVHFASVLSHSYQPADLCHVVSGVVEARSLGCICTSDQSNP